MRIRITDAFIDRQAKDPAEAEVAAGTEMTVTDKRGAELIGHGLAIKIETGRTSTATAKTNQS